MTEFIVRGINTIAAVSVVACAIRQVPTLWETSVLDCLVVGSALGMTVVILVARAFEGRVFPSTLIILTGSVIGALVLSWWVAI